MKPEATTATLTLADIEATIVKMESAPHVLPLTFLPWWMKDRFEEFVATLSPADQTGFRASCRFTDKP